MDRIFITPLAKKLAHINQIDINSLTGSGPRGRITKSDVEKIIKNKELNISEQRAKQTSIINDDQKEIVETSKIRKLIADKLTLSKSTIPHFYLRRSIHVDNLLSVRKNINDNLDSKNRKISINDFFIKASAVALAESPDCNIIWEEEHLVKFKNSNIGVAISSNSGLYTPTLNNVQSKSLSDISKEMKLLITKADEKSLRGTDFGECSHAISNLGMYGVDNFDAIINPPNSSILAIGAVQNRLEIVNEKTQESKIVSLTLSVDHRAIDGATAANFLNKIVFYIENPNLLMIK